jgi:uncharacterized repeat protein (TIGR02543 family)
MHKSFPHLLPSLIFAFLLFFIPSWNEVSAYSTDAETQGVILYVKPGANGNCTSWLDACELQTALFNAMTGDQIWVVAGTYKPTTSTSRTATFQLKSGVAIYGGFPAAGGEMAERNWATNLTTLSGDIGIVGSNSDNSYHVVTGSAVDATSVLDGFTIASGYASGSVSPHNNGGGMYNINSSPTLTNVTFSGNSGRGGGGLYNEYSSPTLTNVTFTSNSAVYNGGGMYNTDSSPTLTNVTFSDNSAAYNGGGMYNGNSSPTLTNVTFTGNKADIGYGQGGGMFNTDSSPMLTNVTFSGNSATYSGGGMYNGTSSPTLTNVTFNFNSAVQGGGMYNYLNSNPVLTNVTFSSNTADFGGGMMCSDSSSPTLTTVIFSNNSADYSGGGVYNINSSSPTLTNVTFSGNSANINGGGGMNNYDNSSPTLTNVTFSGNSATYSGGGMSNDGSSPTVTNVTFSGNSASDGAGMYNYGSNPSLTNVTFSSNIASTTGGGMYNYNSSNPTITNTIVWGNSPDQIYNTEDSTPSITYSDIQGGGYLETGNIDADPLLGGLADNGGFTLTHALDALSPAIDTGSQEVCPVIDQRIYVRPIDGNNDGTTTCDMGAYEYASYPALFSLTVTIEGIGSVNINPNKLEYQSGEEVTLTALPNPGWSFIGWTGDASGTSSQIVVTMNENIEITATFTQNEYSLSTSVNPAGMGSVAISPLKPNYHFGDVVTLTATGETGWWLESWSGDVSGNKNPLTFTIVGNTNIVANFTDIFHTYLPAILK